MKIAIEAKNFWSSSGRGFSMGIVQPSLDDWPRLFRIIRRADLLLRAQAA